MHAQPEQVVVVGILVASEGRGDELFSALRECAVLAREEEGCLSYELHRDSSDPKRLVVYEKYRGQDALLEHRGSSHVAALAAKLGSPGLLGARPTLVYANPLDVADQGNG